MATEDFRVVISSDPDSEGDDRDRDPDFRTLFSVFRVRFSCSV
jgi:hypothetical protein